MFCLHVNNVKAKLNRNAIKNLTANCHCRDFYYSLVFSLFLCFLFIVSFQYLCLIFDQLEEEEQGKVRGEAQGGEGEPAADTEWALKLEREEHRRLLAESHNTSLDLRWKLQHGEKRWNRERVDLLEHFNRERQEWDSSMRELHRKMERVREGRE